MQNFTKIGEQMRHIILTKHATFNVNLTIGGAITVITVKNHYIYLVNYLHLPKNAILIIDLGGYSHVNTMFCTFCA